MRKMILILILILLGIISLIIYLFSYVGNEPGKLDEFAKCLKANGAIFYGTFWCPHCQNQKKLFGRSSKFLPYVECSTPDGRAQLLICKEKNIEGYPTWEFADKSRILGEVSLKTLSEKTNCPLPN
jgi:hypothetical protein